MKKILLFAMMPLVLAVSCAPEPKKELPPVEGAYTAELIYSNSGLTADSSTVVTPVTLNAKEDSRVKYELVFSPSCRVTTKDGYTQMVLEPTAYIKSVSTYKTARIICDFYALKGTNYGVYPNKEGTGDKLDYHETSITPTFNDDSSAVYEYEVNSADWLIKNEDEFKKPSFYKITFVFQFEGE